LLVESERRCRFPEVHRGTYISISSRNERIADSMYRTPLLLSPTACRCSTKLSPKYSRYW
jgi:hypothetical protein